MYHIFTLSIYHGACVYFSWLNWLFRDDDPLDFGEVGQIAGAHVF